MSELKIITGRRITRHAVDVVVKRADDVSSAGGHPLIPRHELADYSRTIHGGGPLGFDWGHGGRGPAQLALAILAACLGDAAAIELHQKFKWAVVARLRKERWQLTSDEVEAWARDCDRRNAQPARPLGESSWEN